MKQLKRTMGVALLTEKLIFLTENKIFTSIYFKLKSNINHELDLGEKVKYKRCYFLKHSHALS